MSLTDSSGTFTGSAFTATTASLENVTPSLTYYSGTSVTGTNLLGSVPSTVGTYTVLASFAGSTDYTTGSTSTSFTISRAAPTVSVTDNSGAYNGSAFVATDTVNGSASLEGVTPGLTYYSGTSATGTALSGAPTTVGTYTVLASFAGSTDYTSTSTSTAFTISQAAPTVSLTDSSGTFTGSAFTATTASLENVTPSLTYYSGTSVTGTNLLGSVPSTVGTYTVLASFAGSTDYTTGSTSTSFTIGQTAATVSVTDNSGAYNGSAFVATDTVNGSASLEGVTPGLTYYSGTSATGTALSGAPTTVGTYTVLASFAGSTDYTTGSTSTSFTIGQTAATVSVTDNSGAYNGSAFVATDTVNGSASLEGVTPGLTYYSGTSATGTALSGAPTTVGTYTVLASFAGSTDYTTGSTSTSFTIGQTAATVSVTDNSGAYNGSAFVATDTVNGSASLEGVPPTLTYYDGSAVDGSGTSAAPIYVGTYTVVASFAGSTDYPAAQSSPVTFTISPATPAIGQAGYYVGSYSGTTTAGTSIENVNGPVVFSLDSSNVITVTNPGQGSGTVTSGGSLSMSGSGAIGGMNNTAYIYAGTVANSAAGIETVTNGTWNATFTGGTASGTWTAAATYTLTVNDAGGIYNGIPFPASASAIGVGDTPITGSFSFTYTDSQGHASSTAPTNAGSYAVVATFTSMDSNYASGTASTTFTINQALPIFSIAPAQATSSATGPTTISFDVSLSQAPNQNVSVTVSTANGTGSDAAIAGTDYTATTQTLTFTPTSSLTQTFVVPIYQATQIQNNKTFLVNLSSPSAGSAVGTQSQAVGTIINGSFPVLAISNVTVSEGTSGMTPVVFTATLSEPSTQTITVDYATQDDLGATGAKANTNYTATDGTLTFLPGQTVATISVPITNETNTTGTPPTQSFNLILSAPVNVTLAQTSAVGTLNEAPLTNETITVGSGTGFYSETSNSTVTFAITLSTPAPAGGVTFNYSTQDGTAVAGTDYVAVLGGVATIPAGQTTGSISITTLPEPGSPASKTFTLMLSNPNSGTLAATSVTSTILPTPAQPIFHGPTSLTANEGVPLPLSGLLISDADSAVANHIFKISVLSQHGTLTADVDVPGGVPAGNISDNGTGSLTVTGTLAQINASLAAADGVVYEADDYLGPDTLLASISDQSSGSQPQQPGTGAISITVLSRSINVGIQPVDGDNNNGSNVNVAVTAPTDTFIVTLSAPSTQAVTIRYTTVDNTAQAGVDYTPMTGTITFQPGETQQTIVVPVTTSVQTASPKSFFVVLLAADNASFSDSQAVGLIPTIDPNTFVPPPVSAVSPVSSVPSASSASSASPVPSTSNPVSTITHQFNKISDLAIVALGALADDAQPQCEQRHLDA